MLEIGLKLAKDFKTAYSKHYEVYIASISDLHLQFKRYVEEEGGITTPTNIKSFGSLTSVQSHQQNEKINGSRRSSLEEVEGSCSTPVQNSVTLSPSEGISVLPNKLESSSNFTKVNHFTLLCIDLQKIVIKHFSVLRN